VGSGKALENHLRVKNNSEEWGRDEEKDSTKSGQTYLKQGREHQLVSSPRRRNNRAVSTPGYRKS